MRLMVQILMVLLLAFSARGDVFTLSSSDVKDGGNLPVAFTGDGESATLPLQWSGAPAGAACYALIMHHVAPDMIKWYWTLYNIPADVQSLPKNAKGIGIQGTNSVNGKLEYAPPHSKGPGPKEYTYTLYALNAQLNLPPAQVTRETLLAAMKDHILGSAELHVVYSRSVGEGTPPPNPGRRPEPELAPSAAMNARLAFSVISGRPTATAITLNVLSANALEGYVEYGLVQGTYPQKSAPTAFPAGTPVEIALNGLQADTQYYYRLCTRQPGTAAFSAGNVQSFHTQRAPGSAFTFAIQGDSHPERPQMFAPPLFAQTLAAVAADHPDFYLTIGDDFSVDTLREITPDAVKNIYLRQRAYLSAVGAPLFLVNGNHEQAAGCNLDGTPDNVAVWAQTARNAFFPQPAPDNFYSGDAQPVEHIGNLRDYYAWTWGDALFVVIDPYWHSKMAVDNPLGNGEKTRDLWNSTLGDAQYQWLQRTLEGSTAKYKFVFTHHVLGTGRGGVEEAELCEWGGNDRRGADRFAAMRPGWAMPIQQLFAKTGVTIFFQGHDHIFVRQQLDGVVYQTLPLPADPFYSLYNAEAYRTGDKLPGSGYVRVKVAPDKVTVEYVRQYLPKDETADHKSNEVAFSYTVPARKP